MTTSKKISKSIKELLKNPLVLDALDRSSDISTAAISACDFWSYDLLKRKPSSAYDDYGLFQGTDLDLAVFLYSISERGAIINIPRYKSMRQAKIREDQTLTSKENRNGQIIGVQANKDFFSFSINIIDQNIIGEDKVGAFRTFSMTDLNGSWYSGWDTIQFVPTAKENRFITENRLWTGNRIVFTNMIHPNRWTSFFGHHYIISKIMIDRLTEESKHLNAEIKRIQAAGIKFPKSDGPASYPTSYGDSKSIKVMAFQAKVFIPQPKYVGVYSKAATTQKGLIDAYQTRKNYQRWIKRLRFMIRATEFAHSQVPNNMPAWIKGVKWEDDFKESSKSRTRWQRLPLFQDKVGEHSISLLRRWYEKSAKVAIDYQIN